MAATGALGKGGGLTNLTEPRARVWTATAPKAAASRAKSVKEALR